MKGGVLLGMVLAVSLAAPASASAPKLPRGFAGERFASVTLRRGLPVTDWRGVQAYMHWDSLVDADTAKAASQPRSNELDTDFGVLTSVRGCVRTDRNYDRIFVLAGLGSRFDFVIYRHRPERSNDPEHDHLLVFHHAGGERTLAFSCVGKLPRKVSAVSAAVAAGRCTEETGLFETR
jgi:hypothetical protein